MALELDFWSFCFRSCGRAVFAFVNVTAGSPAGAVELQCLPLFLQGDDSLSAVTFDSDVETVSAAGHQPCAPGLVVLPLQISLRLVKWAILHNTVLRAGMHIPNATWCLKSFQPFVGFKYLW